MSISTNLQNIRKQIHDTAVRCGRSTDEITLVAVSKKKPLQDIEDALTCGQKVFGENYIQEAADKILHFKGRASFHFIGHLQSNKAKTAVALFDLIETVDRLKIARAIDKYAAELGSTQDILIQVNVGREKQKSGVLPEHLLVFLESIQYLKQLRIRGLMTMPPFSDNPEDSRPYFKILRELKDKPSIRKYFSDKGPTLLSMGMSGDFTVAIEEGANLVRVGTAIFGPRHNK